MVGTYHCSAKGAGGDKAGPARPQPLQPFARYPEETKPWDGIPVIIDCSVGYRCRCRYSRWHSCRFVTTASRQLPRRLGFALLRASTCWANRPHAISQDVFDHYISACLHLNLSEVIQRWVGCRDWVGDRGLTGSPPREDSRRGVRDDRFGFMPLSFVPEEESPEDRATQLQVDRATHRRHRLLSDQPYPYHALNEVTNEYAWQRV